jgi:hypothetical protein
MVDSSTATGTCAVCVVDKERSLVANLAAANNFKVRSCEWSGSGVKAQLEAGAAGAAGPEARAALQVLLAGFSQWPAPLQLAWPGPSAATASPLLSVGSSSAPLQPHRASGPLLSCRRPPTTATRTHTQTQTQVAHIEQPENWAVVEAARVVYSAGFFITVSPEAIMKTAQHCCASDKVYCMVRGSRAEAAAGHQQQRTCALRRRVAPGAVRQPPEHQAAPLVPPCCRGASSSPLTLRPLLTPVPSHPRPRRRTCLRPSSCKCRPSRRP